MAGYSSDMWKGKIYSSSFAVPVNTPLEIYNLIGLRQTFWSRSFKKEEKNQQQYERLACSHCKHNGLIYDYAACLNATKAHTCTFVCAHMCLSFYRPCTWPIFFFIVLPVPQWGGRRGRLTVFPVGEALMLSPGGNAVHSHFPFIYCVSFNVYTTSKVTKPFTLLATCF